MLTLGRKVGERILLDTADGPVTITVVAAEGNRARLAFKAPASVIILREELVAKKSEGERDEQISASDP